MSIFCFLLFLLFIFSFSLFLFSIFYIDLFVVAQAYYLLADRLELGKGAKPPCDPGKPEDKDRRNTRWEEPGQIEKFSML